MASRVTPELIKCFMRILVFFPKTAGLGLCLDVHNMPLFEFIGPKKTVFKLSLYSNPHDFGSLKA